MIIASRRRNPTGGVEQGEGLFQHLSARTCETGLIHDILNSFALRGVVNIVHAGLGSPGLHQLSHTGLHLDAQSNHPQRQKGNAK